MNTDPWDQLLGEAAVVTDDPWTRWNVAWEDASVPIADLPAYQTMPGRPDRQGGDDAGKGRPCGLCGVALEAWLWDIGRVDGRPALICGGRRWAACARQQRSMQG